MKIWQKLKNNPALWDRYFLREQAVRAIRSFFTERSFHEIEAPTLVETPAAESYLDLFSTTLYDHYRTPKPVFLSTSPELALKKLIVGGVGNCYSLGKSFRNMESHSNLHQPEFTLLEWYRVKADYLATMIDCEQLLLAVYRALRPENQQTLIYQGKKIDLTPPWERLSMKEAFSRYAKADLEGALDLGGIQKLATSKGYRVETQSTWEELFNQIYLNEIETHLGQNKPTIIYDFPIQLAALAKKKSIDSRWAERFEFYIGGLELGDGYSELTDWREQEERFKKEMQKIIRLGKTEYNYDQDFIEALKVGLPECSGVAVGVDRLVMLITDVARIQDVLWFPLS